MRIGPGVWMVASGSLGASMSSPWDCNVYAIRAGRETWLIDAGVGHEPGRIEAELRADGIERIDKVLVTHGHLDHSGGAHHWRAQGAKVWAAPLTARWLEAGDEDAIHLPTARRDGVYPSGFTFTPCPVDRVLQPGESIELRDDGDGHLRLDVIAAPGHAADMVCFAITRVVRRENAPPPLLFSADAFFYAGRIAYIRTPDSDLAAYERTLRALLAEVSFDACYPGHGIWLASGARGHLEKAVACFDRGAVPPNLE